MQDSCWNAVSLYWYYLSATKYGNRFNPLTLMSESGQQRHLLRTMQIMAAIVALIVAPPDTNDTNIKKDEKQKTNNSDEPSQTNLSD